MTWTCWIIYKHFSKLWKIFIQSQISLIFCEQCSTMYVHKNFMSKLQFFKASVMTKLQFQITKFIIIIDMLEVTYWFYLLCMPNAFRQLVCHLFPFESYCDVTILIIKLQFLLPGAKLDSRGPVDFGQVGLPETHKNGWGPHPPQKHIRISTKS